MDIICILVGAIIAMVGFIVCTDGAFIGLIGLGIFIYGLVINHLAHQGKY